MPTTATSTVWSAGERKRLEGSLNRAFARAIRGAQRWSLAVVAADGETIYDNHADDAAAPASVQKLVVAATALNDLGPEYRYHTVFAAQSAVGDDGTLAGDLWLVGSGDPSLTTADVSGGVGVLARSGLRRIDGGVAVDATGMTGPGLNPHWAPDDIGQDYAAPTSAVSLDGDTIEEHLVSDGDPQTAWVPMRDVPRHVGKVLAGLLASRGITAADPPVVAAAPLDTVVLWDHRSSTLRSLEAHMLFVSDNHYAEQLLRTVGGEYGGDADDADGIDAERRFLSERGIPTPGLRLLDGSGLAPRNRIAAITLARLLDDVEARGGDRSLYLLLPLGGRQGTVEDYDFTSALGRVRAKTGHIDGVASLAGYVNTLHHGRVAFAFLVNGSPGDPDDAYVSAVNRLADF